MFFSLELALAALPELGPRTRAALAGAAARRRDAAAAQPARGASRWPAAPTRTTLGLRVPRAARRRRAGAVRWPVLQSSANLAGGPDARRLADVPATIRDGADLVLDGGELPGTPSTVIDLRRYEDDGSWDVVREGAVARRCATVADGPCRYRRRAP